MSFLPPLQMWLYRSHDSPPSLPDDMEVVEVAAAEPHVEEGQAEDLSDQLAALRQTVEEREAKVERLLHRIAKLEAETARLRERGKLATFAAAAALLLFWK